MKTPASSKLLYVLGVIFLCVSAYMLYAAITYTQLYLATYEADFVDLWPNTVKYVIEHFVPYFAFGVICIGVGKAIATFAKAKTVSEEDEEAKSLGMKVRDEDMEELKSHELDVASELEKEYQKRLDESRMMLATEMATYDMRRDKTEKSILSRLEELEASLLAKASLPAVSEDEEEPAEIEEPIEVEEPEEKPVEVEEPEEEPAEVEEPVEESVEEFEEESAEVEESVEEPAEEPEEEPAEVEEPVEEPAEELEEEPAEVEESAEEADEEIAEEPVEEETEGSEDVEEQDEEPVEEEPAEEESEETEETEEVEEPIEEESEETEEVEEPIEEAEEQVEESAEEPAEEESEEAEEPTPILQPDESFASAFEKPTVYTVSRED